MLELEAAEYLGLTRKKFVAEGVVISEVEYRRAVSEEWHSHQNKHITLIVNGGNEEQRKNAEILARAGTVLTYDGGELHRNLNTLHPSKNINLEIEDSFFANYSLDPASFERLPPERPGLKLALLRAHRECLSDDTQSVLVIHSLLLDLLSPHRRGRTSNERPLWLERVRELIHDRWDEKLSLNELSLLAGVHPVTISKNFPKHFSCPLGEYMRRLRIEKSLHLIKQTQTPLTDIALRCGFADQSHFIRVFKAETGFLPRGCLRSGSE